MKTANGSPVSSPSRQHRNRDSTVPTRHRQLWPSSATKRISGTLADHISEDRIIDRTGAAPAPHTPIMGGSARLASAYCKKELSRNIVPGRLSLDHENAKSLSSRRHSAELEPDVEVEAARTLTLRMRRSRRGTSDSNVPRLKLNGDSSSVLKGLRVAGASKSSWALSPGRASSPAMSVESMDKAISFSTFNHRPTKVKGVDKLLNMGFHLFKTNKTTTARLASSSPTPAFGLTHHLFHTLRLLQNRFIQWRFANARAQLVNANISHKAQSNLIYVWDGLTKLQHSVLKKKIQFLREKLEMKIAFVLYSQIKLLEAWGGMERQHLQAIIAIKECLHSVVCRVPLLEGARVSMQSTSVALRHAIDLTAFINSILTTFSSSEVDKIAAMLSELAKVVAREKQLLEEFYDIFQTICVFEVQERSVKCNLVQLECWQQKYQLQQLHTDIAS